MSEFAKMLTAVSTRRRVAEYPPISAVMDVRDTLSKVNFDESIEYRIEVKIGALAVAGDDTELKHLVPVVKRRIVEHVFGEFRKQLLDARAATYERDFQKLDEILGTIYNQMFEEGINHA